MKGAKRNLFYLIFIFLMILFFIFSVKKLPFLNVENRQISYLILIQMFFLLLLVFAFLFVALKGLLYFIYEKKEKILGKKIRTKFFNIIFLIIVIISIPFSLYQIFFTNYLYKKWGSNFVKKAVLSNVEFSRYLIENKAKDFLKKLRENEKNFSNRIFKGNIELGKSSYIFKDNKIIVKYNNRLYFLPLSKKEVEFILMSKENYEKYLYDIKFQKKATRYFLIISILIITLLLFVLSFWVAGFFGKNIIASIENLLNGTEEIKKGNFNYKIPKISTDELGILTDRFNEMITIIKKNQDDLLMLNETLKKERNFQKEIFSLLITPIVVFDKNFKIFFKNNSFKSFSRYLNENFYDDIIKQLKMNETDNVIKIKKRIGNRFYVLNVIKISQGYILLIEDFTDVLQIRMVEMAQQMARKLAHELKNPLTPISLSIDRILKKFKDKSPDFDEVFLENTKIIREEIQRLSNLIAHFSKFAKLPPPKMEEFDYKKFLEELIKFYSENYRNKIEIIMNYNCEVKNIVGDPLQLKQVFINLFANSIDAIKKKGIIQIDVSGNDKFIITKFSDNGSGISKENLNKIFDIYFSTKTDGSGLGLTMVKRIIDEHDGKIEVASQNGKTTFTIYLKKIL